MADVCGTCNTPENFPEDPKSELRPYGPGGSLICYRCAFKDEESENRTEGAFGALLDAAVATSQTGIIIIGGKEGPR